MTTKREFKRSDMVVAGQHQPFECVLCGSHGIEPAGIPHAAACVFARNSVTGIRIDGVSGGVVFRPGRNRWWWTSPASGACYRIEKLPGRYVMFEEYGTNEVKTCRNLLELRLWVGLNQGTL